MSNTVCAVVVHRWYNFPRALDLMRSASDSLMFPARSERVAPLIAKRACVASLTGKLRPGPAKELFGIFLRSAAYNFIQFPLPLRLALLRAGCKVVKLLVGHLEQPPVSRIEFAGGVLCDLHGGLLRNTFSWNGRLPCAMQFLHIFR